MDKETNQLEKLIKKEIRKIPKDAVYTLSGGIDSSLLFALAKEINPKLPKAVVTVHIPYGKKFNEFKYAQRVFDYLDNGLTEQIIVEFDESRFDDVMKKAVKAIGRPIPHFNIFTLYCMYEELAKRGVKNVVLGDGPDETMCGYARHLIMNYIFKIYEVESFENYKGKIDKILSSPIVLYSKLVGLPYKEVEKIWDNKKSLINNMCLVDIILKRPEMDDMSNGIAKYFGITNIRPYQDNKELDDFMFNLSPEMKISRNGKYGKYFLRELASKPIKFILDGGQEWPTKNLLPDEITWRVGKMGGPLLPVNKIKGWEKTDGEFGKSSYLKYQEKILRGGE
jgi:asparagine synthetase B (glutamine-hydrolysing)